MSKRGLVVQSLFAPVIGAQDGKYVLIDRDEKEVAEDMRSVMQTFFRG